MSIAEKIKNVLGIPTEKVTPPETTTLSPLELKIKSKHLAEEAKIIR